LRPDFRAMAAVAIGGAVGSVARYVVNLLIQGRAGPDFPLGTMMINISGSLILGALATIGLETTVLSPELRLLLTTGFCGGYTTFSTFSLDAVQLMERREFQRASWYVIGSVGLSLVGTIIGVALVRQLIHVARGRA